MIFDPEEKLKELFKKYMNLSVEGSTVSDEVFEDNYFHQMEYFDWEYWDDELKFKGAINSNYSLMNIFFGQDDKIEFIHRDFLEYLRSAKAHLLITVVDACVELRKLDIPCEKLYLPFYWSKLISSVELYGMVIISPDYDEPVIPKIESSKEYGRFVTFSL